MKIMIKSGKVEDGQATEELTLICFFHQNILFFPANLSHLFFNFSLVFTNYWSLFLSLQTIPKGEGGCFCLYKYESKLIFLVPAHVLNCAFLRASVCRRK